MPCSDGLVDQRRSYADDPALIIRLNKATRYLCALLQGLEGSDFLKSFFDVAPEIKAWWENHQLEDKQRKEREMERFRKHQERLKILEKLTEEERKILGV